jgi:hypothetical protein
MNEWPFDQGPTVACITTAQVLEQHLPVLRVTHYDDDHSWGFTCGTTNNSQDARVVGMGEMLKLDPSLASIADLLPGWSAYRRTPNGPWERFPSSHDQNEEA